MKYSIDTSAILDGWVRYYSPDVFPPLWEKLDELIKSGDLRATEEVLRELEKQDDKAHRWARERSGMFHPLDEAVQRAATEVLAAHPRLIDNRANRNPADPFVIALAKVNGCHVITGERFSTSLAKPNIPDACVAMGIPWTNMLGLFRAEKWVFPTISNR